MKEYVSLQAVLDIVIQYCPDDDGSCSKADIDIRDVLDEIEEIPATDVQPVLNIKKLQEHIKQRILETAANNGGIYREVAEDISDRIDIWVDEFGRAENDI